MDWINAYICRRIRYSKETDEILRSTINRGEQWLAWNVCRWTAACRYDISLNREKRDVFNEINATSFSLLGCEIAAPRRSNAPTHVVFLNYVVYHDSKEFQANSLWLRLTRLNRNLIKLFLLNYIAYMRERSDSESY